jgi:hypothetical protein
MHSGQSVIDLLPTSQSEICFDNHCKIGLRASLGSKLTTAALKIPLLLLLAVSCFVLLFVGGPDVGSVRSFKYAWNLGHIIAFGLWTYLLLRYWDRLIHKSFWQQCLLMLVVTIVLGGLIEIAQYGPRRTPDMGDMVRNVIGAQLALAFFSPARKQILNRPLRLFQVALFAAALVQLIPVALALTDECQAARQFPVLADFETPWETSRWGGDAEFTRDRRFTRNGRYSLKVELNTTTYSGVSLNYFPSDWRGFKYLQFDIYNPSDKALKVTCRIHDALHAENELRYNDRFNRSYRLDPGWNAIRISLAEVAAAPRTRSMNLQAIMDFSIFAVRLPQTQTLYLDHVRLQR